MCVLRNEIISNKQYFDQVLADANVSSQTSKLIAKIELLEKENMELRRTVINKEIIIQKLFSNKNITKEIPKNDKTDFRLTKMKNTLSAKVLQNVQIYQKKTSIKEKDSVQIDKSENNINKQLTEICHNKHKNYFQSKNLERNRNQSNKEERQDVHQ